MRLLGKFIIYYDELLIPSTYNPKGLIQMTTPTQTIVFLLVLMTGFVISGCEREEVVEPDPHEAFFQNLSTFCNKMFSGEATFPDVPDHPLVDTELRIHFSSCDDDITRIELYRDVDYWHGAWVLERRDHGLHLYHDHLGDVRTEEDLGENDAHGYGGYADDRGTAVRQYFPADEVTAEMLPEAATNVWMIELNLEEEQFIYYLERHDEPRFRTVFNLAEPLDE